ncbi:DUF7662 domain-containing protein [Rubellimicrobium aerolatum]|uniref:DUF7662 domain-containing protein n=1 Tax=Rubellimicrobium aerolatum TaxID=490979 RepID=UPI003CC90FB0|nr:hypothetical protein [Rubellimicrobium aerolatum]
MAPAQSGDLQVSKYDPLSAYLSGPGPSSRRLSFTEIEEILGFALPPSAREHGPWWANDRTHTQAKAWLSIGWETAEWDITSERVTFRRAD